jgi:hypothetical protein
MRPLNIKDLKMSVGQIIYVMWHGVERKAQIIKIRDGVPHVRFL